MWWYDTSTSLLKRRNNADDAWITVGLEAASTDGTFSANSDSLVPTQKAAKTYADTKVSKSTAAEIYNVTEKATPAANDVLLLEDSAASYAKKSVKVSSIRQTIDAILPSQTGNSGKFLTTNGTNASWGAVSLVPTYNADAYAVIASAATEESTASGSYVKLKEITLHGGGTLTFTWSMSTKGVHPDARAYGKIYRNGVAVGTEKYVSNATSYSVVTNTVSGWSDGDKIQLYVKRGGAGYDAWVKDFKVSGTQCTINND
jgi:hypothetical protein